MNKWEYLWIVIQRDSKSFYKFSDWYIKLPNNAKIEGKEKVVEYLNELGDQGWEQSSSTGEHLAETTYMNSIHLFFKRNRNV